MKRTYRIIYLIAVIIFIGIVVYKQFTMNKSYNKFTYLEYTISDLQKGYEAGDFTIQDVTKAYLYRIEIIDDDGPELNAIISVNRDALAFAEELDKELQAGHIRSVLHGIPIVLKDNIDTQDKMPTTGGSRALKRSYREQDSFVAKQLRDAGAIIIGKANLSEWANFRGELSSSGWSAVGGQTKNPA